MMNGGRVEFYANWYKTDRMGQLRERIFVDRALDRFRLPVLPVAVQQPGLLVLVGADRDVAARSLTASASSRMIDSGLHEVDSRRRVAVEAPDVERLLGR